MNILGFEADDRTEKMVARIQKLSPKRPLKFGEISATSHAIGGTEVFSNEIRVSLRSAFLSHDLISHELAHALIELEHGYLAIPDVIPRGSQDRRMLGTILSMFEHPNVYEIQRSYGFDVVAGMEEKFSEYIADFDNMPPEHPTEVRLEKIAGYVELHYAYPKERLTEIDPLFKATAPRSFAIAKRLLARVVTPDRVSRYAFGEMLDAFVAVIGLQGAYWPPLIRRMPAARSDRG